MKAIGLLSGGLDSTLALKLMLNQGIDVIALNFTSLFCTCNRCYAIELLKKEKIPFKLINKGDEDLKIIRSPKHGYGSGINPCIDCRIFILKKAKKIMKETKAKFIFTGEVLNQRPMSQYRKALDIIEKESGLKGLILRPLSAKLLSETIPEKKGWVKREKLLAIKGRTRKEQISLAGKFNLNYPCPSGGCLLTQKEFAAKVKDVFKYKKKVNENDMKLLRLGRHFRFHENQRFSGHQKSKISACKDNKIIVGRNKTENEELLKEKGIFFEVPNVGSPVTLLLGKKNKEAIIKAAQLTAFHSDNKDEKVKVRYGKGKLNKEIIVNKISKEEVDRLRI